MVVCRDMLFPEENPATARKTLHQMLRPLEDKVPTQMRETHQWGVGKLGGNLGELFNVDLFILHLPAHNAYRATRCRNADLAHEHSQAAVVPIKK